MLAVGTTLWWVVLQPMWRRRLTSEIARLPPGDDPAALMQGARCDDTFTNVRKPKLTIKKVLKPATDPGRFDLMAGALVVKAAAGNGDSGSVLTSRGR